MPTEDLGPRKVDLTIEKVRSGLVYAVVGCKLGKIDRRRMKFEIKAVRLDNY